MKIINLGIIAMIVSSLFLLAAVSVEAADDIITDGTGDVTSIDTLGESIVIAESPYISVNNLDIIEATYTKQGTQVTLTLQVNGLIENRGKAIDENSLIINALEYAFILETSEDSYYLSYTNQTGTLSYSSGEINLTSSDFSVDGGTLTVWFNLGSANEAYSSLQVTTTYMKVDSMDELESMLFISDVAPNPPLAVFEAYAYDLGSVGESIQFNATMEPLTGQPPYSYHWDFGDGQSIDDVQNPTHKYTKAGVYTYNFTVTDSGGATASATGSITISGEGGGSGSLSTQMIMFLAVLIIIIVIGIVIIVWIIRR